MSATENSKTNSDPNIPFLPGYTVHNESFKNDFRKSHTLDYLNGYSVSRKPILGIGEENVHNQLEKMHLQEELKIQPDISVLQYDPRTVQVPAKPFIPAHVAFDKLVLRFFAYFKQTVHMSTEQYILRKVKILLYLEDDSIAVIETPQQNSGISQGILISRQRLPKNDTEYYTAYDFNLASEITLYGKTFRITSCDAFTEKYFSEQLKVKLNPPEPMPKDSNKERKVQHSSMSKVQHDDNLKRFLQNDRKVLRFYTIWDDRENMYGELRYFTIHYFLVDDSIEVREVQRPNQGRDPHPVVLRRQQLPKVYEGLDMTHVPKYTWRDFAIGKVINVLERPILIYDMDNYTRAYYKENLGCTDTQLQPMKLNVENSGQEIKRELPPYNGFGTLDDSLGSVKYLVLKPPKKDFVKMLENEHKVLRFVAILDSAHRVDSNRHFVISYRLADDMMTIYEPLQRNSGFLGGKFLERTRVLKPGHSLQNPNYYNAPDLFVGAKLTVNHHTFILIDADEYVFSYMEQNPTQFQQSDWQNVVGKIKQRKEQVQKLLESAREKTKGQITESGEQFLNRSQFLEALFPVIQNQQQNSVSKHELITLARHYEQSGKNQILLSNLVNDLK